MQSYSGPDLSNNVIQRDNSKAKSIKAKYLTRQIVLNSIFFDTQRPKRRSIAILVENEPTEQMNNETAQQVKEISFTCNGDIRQCKQNNFLVSVVCV